MGKLLESIVEVPSQADLHKLFTLDAETGALFWRESGKGRGDITTPAGTFDKVNGGHRIMLNGVLYQRSRLVRQYVKGDVTPDWMVDHVNRVKNDDRPINIRLVTNHEFVPPVQLELF